MEKEVGLLLIPQKEQRQTTLWLQFLFITHTLQKKKKTSWFEWLSERDGCSRSYSTVTKPKHF